MNPPVFRCLLALVAMSAGPLVSLRADPPAVSYLFPAGGQRGTTVDIRLGGVNLHSRCGVELTGRGAVADPVFRVTATPWFEGPMLPLPDSQRAEDYPRAMAGRVTIAPDAPLGPRSVRAWTSQGAASGPIFVVGDLPEIVERETDTQAVPRVTLPVTINGRIFPREEVDEWTFSARAGQTITASLLADKIGSPLTAVVELRDSAGRLLATSHQTEGANDRLIQHTLPADGDYRVRVYDVRGQGGPAHVYRLTLTVGPTVTAAFPLGGRRGTPTRFELAGANLPPGTVAITLPRDGPTNYDHRLNVADLLTPPFRLDLDDLPEAMEDAPPVAPPVVLNGRIGKPAEVDSWRIRLAKGKPIEFEVRAKKLDSPLLAAIVIRDPTGKELAKADAVTTGGNDPVARITPAVDGDYTLTIADRFATRGGPRFAYRVRVTPPEVEPDFRLRFDASTATVSRGGTAKIRLHADRRGGYTGPISLSIEGLPKGVTASAATIAANQASAEIALKADADAPITVAKLTLRGTATLGDRPQTRSATFASRGVENDTLLLAVAMPTPFKITSDYLLTQAPRGTVFAKRYKIDRQGFTGPLTIRLADRQARHLQGVSGPTLTIPPGQTEFDYPITMPSWMEIGRTCRVCIMGIGVVRDADGVEHEVSFSSTDQQMQLIVVVEPGRLGLTLDRGSVRGSPGQWVSLPLAIRRGTGLTGPVTVELVADDPSIRAEPLTIPAGQSGGELKWRVTRSGTWTIRAATRDERGQPVTAEARVDVVASP
jgi:hypothetical protein